MTLDSRAGSSRDNHLKKATKATPATKHQRQQGATAVRGDLRSQRAACLFSITVDRLLTDSSSGKALLKSAATAP
jgi:hypothetical protein